MTKVEKTPKWKKYVAPKRDYKGWISLVIGACAVWIAYESFLFQKNQSGNENIDESPGIENPSSNNQEAQFSSPNPDNTNSSPSDQGNSESNSTNSNGTADSKKDPIETATDIYEGYKKLNIDPENFKRNKDKEK